jgi:hypothetical protein
MDLRLPVDRVREIVATAVRSRIAGNPRGPVVDVSGDAGWFGPASVAWRMHADLSQDHWCLLFSNHRKVGNLIHTFFYIDTLPL